MVLKIHIREMLRQKISEKKESRIIILSTNLFMDSNQPTNRKNMIFLWLPTRSHQSILP